MNAPIGIIAVIVAAKYIPNYRLSKGIKLDWIGFASVVIGTSALLVAFSVAHSWGWASWETLGMLAAGILILTYFIRRTLRVSNPLLNLSVLKISRFTYGLILNCCITISLYAAALLIPVFMQTVKGESSLTTGLIMLPGTLAMTLVSLAAGKLYGKVGPARLILVGLVLMGIATWELSHANAATSALFITVWLIIRYNRYRLQQYAGNECGNVSCAKRKLRPCLCSNELDQAGVVGAVN
ncbi:hypothetical protein BK133_28725 [Paenibacillus sp. FSL H8-0548]|uniref:hypothetical protein n=1 Tax=Paenibacillus sp. FSL H8-0548 TaxID=1920422 RepID=UPI00096CFD56|nr:hypothetical protein [Paenibacillus sp. FSL H8-0548]OMF21166.1 hypothetical protein BK133_28725 [Paenibacillus sp. FSL H8-0548]